MTTRSPIPGIYWLGDLELALGECGRNILKKRPALERAGFPPPLPRLSANERLRWPAFEVEAWITAQRSGAGAQPAAANDGGRTGTAGPDIAARRARLLASL